MDITYQREHLFDVIDEIGPLLEQHYDELTMHKDVVKLAPIWSDYANLECADKLAIFTARADGRLVGYNAFFLVRHMHYEALTMAVNDVLFLTKEHRRGTVGIKLMRFAEDALRQAGVQKLVYHIKHSLDWSQILYRMGYADEEKIVGKIL
jgi:GNAT superfamily N-acetyltransferase